MKGGSRDDDLFGDDGAKMMRRVVFRDFWRSGFEGMWRDIFIGDLKL